jgi:AcrR family transcriptional regulator
MDGLFQPARTRRSGNGETSVSPGRKNDPERVKQDILKIATEEFARNGLAGARVNAIADRTRTTKAMIYYYFGSKEGLFAAVIEAAYGGIRAAEAALMLDALGPEEALRRLVEFTFDYHDEHSNFVRLVSIENIHHATHIADSMTIQALNDPVIQGLAAILDRGREQGVFTRNVDVIDLHMAISSLCFYRVSNRHTFNTLFRRDLSAPEARERQRRMVADMIVSYLKTA